MVAATLSREFQKSGHVPLFALFRDEVSYPYAGEKFILDSSDQYYLGGRLQAHIRRHFQLKKIIKKQSPDVILSFLEAPNLHNVLVNKRAIVSVRSSKSASAGPPFNWKWLVNYVYRSSWRIITVSEEIKKNIIRSYRIAEDRLVMLPNPIDVDRVRELGSQPVDQKWQAYFMQPVVVSVGSLRREKAQHLLIAAFANALTRRPKLKLLILGEGPLRNELEALTESLRISKHVFFPGRVRNPFKYVKRSQVMVLPSYSEGWPNALVESLALRIPVIATDCYSGPREILVQEKNSGSTSQTPLQTECGVLIPPWTEKKGGKPESLEFLENAIVEMTDKHVESWRQEGFDKLIEGLQADKIAERYLKVLKMAID